MRLASIFGLAAASISVTACTTVTEPSFGSVGPPVTRSSIMAPVVVHVAPAALAVPEGLKVTCLVASDRLASSPTCPVIEYNGRSYWALSHRDNRSSLTIVAYERDSVVAQRELSGVRYVVEARIGAADSTITWVGQGANTVTLRWDRLP